MKITGASAPDRIRLIGFVTRLYAGRAANSGTPRSNFGLEGEIRGVDSPIGGGGELLPLADAERIAAAQVAERFIVVKLRVAREGDVVRNHGAGHSAVAVDGDIGIRSVDYARIIAAAGDFKVLRTGGGAVDL